MTSHVIPPEDYPDIVKRRLAGETLQAIADSYDVSRERIRQIIKDENPEVPRIVQEKADAEREAEEIASLNRQLAVSATLALRHNRKCNVCGSWVLRGDYQNCSPECSEAWKTIRYADNAQEHRVYQAKTFLRSPELYKETQLDWARKVMAGEITERNRKRYIIEGSVSAKLIRKYRPELYEAITRGGE